MQCYDIEITIEVSHFCGDLIIRVMFIITRLINDGAECDF